MSADKLSEALKGVDWNANVAAFISDASAGELLAQANMRIAVWAKQFESIDKGNAALSFVREMQVAGHHVAALIALALYKPAAAAMRNMVEAALYYSYFRSHPVELASLARNTGYFVDKNEVLDHHRAHTQEFMVLQEKLGLLSRLHDWYGEVSAIIHGQIPGAWIDHASLKDVKQVQKTQKAAVEKFVEAEDIIYRLFLCTVAADFWNDVNTEAKKFLLKGLSGEVKSLFKFDGS